MNVLFLTFTHPGYMPPLVLSDRQITAGPGYETTRVDGRVASLNVPLGPFDLPPVIAALPDDQKPELVVVQMDSYENFKPLGLSAVRAPKLLLIADTHHGDGALAKMLDYARSQPFDRVALIHDPHHLHWFAEAGIKDVRYLPNINVRDFEAPFSETRSRRIDFVGQLSANHPRRRYLIEVMRSAGLPIRAGKASAAIAAGIYGKSQITFNCSLNGDLNMRVFEVLGAGGFLVTDRLSPQAGLETFFKAGEHYVDYEGEADLLEKLAYYLARPEECLKIARAGQQAYLAAHTPDHRRREVLAHAGGAPVPPFHDRRANPDLPGFGLNLFERVRLYEMFQTLCLERQKLVVVVDETAGARIASDLADLRPIELHVRVAPERSAAMAAALADLGVAGQVRLASQPPPGWNFMVRDVRSPEAIEGGDRRAVLALVGAGAMQALDRIRLSTAGFAPIGGRDWLFGRKA